MAETAWIQKWQTVSVPEKERAVQMKNWLGEDWQTLFLGKSVVDFGCGDGTNALLILKSGAKKVTLVDQSNIILEKAKHTVNEFRSKVEFVIRDIDKDDLKFDCDAVICIGVLHHLKNPRESLKRILDCSPNAKMYIWVYGSYRNKSLLAAVFGIRVFTKYLPVRANKILAYPLAALLRIIANVFSAPYLRQIRSFSFKHVHEIVFDQILPKQAAYYDEESIKKLVQDLKVSLKKDGNQAGWLITKD